MLHSVAFQGFASGSPLFRGIAPTAIFRPRFTAKRSPSLTLRVSLLAFLVRDSPATQSLFTFFLCERPFVDYQPSDGENIIRPTNERRFVL